MLSNISVGRYYSAKSNVHNMHPLSKVICTIIFILSVFICNKFIGILLLIALLAIIIVNTKIDWSIYFYIIKKIWLIFVLVLILFSLLNLSFIIGFIITIKLMLIVMCLSILTLTTPPNEIVYGFEKCFQPLNKFNVKSNILALYIGDAFRFIPVFVDNYNNILKSQINRGIEYYYNISNYFFNRIKIIVPAFKLSLFNLKEIKKIMLIRLYGITNNRCNFRMNSWGLFDSTLVFIHVMLLFVVLKGEFL